jgi:hypothetical protein
MAYLQVRVAGEVPSGGGAAASGSGLDRLGIKKISGDVRCTAACP